MDLVPGSAAALADDELIATAQVRKATARLFRSVRAGLAWVRERRAMPPSAHPACVPMKGGTGEPAVFLFPGVSGSVFQLGPIASALRIPMAVYAIKPRGFDDGQSPCMTIPEMAEYGIAAIRAVQPRGPYLLAGYSAGGLLALEAAQQLSAAQDNVPLVVLFDTQLGRPSWPWDCHAEILWHGGIRSVRSLFRDRANLADELRQRRARVRRYLAASRVKGMKAPPVALEGLTPESQRVYVATYNAGESYRPSRYPGKVLYLQPMQLDKLQPRSPSRMWRKYLPGLEVRRLPGSHRDGREWRGRRRRRHCRTAAAGGQYRGLQALPAVA
ncbi:MAG: alpha/beta fold hydrolase [Alphaproteobacteria bacterium]|nr:alpha/beta fold hydrolase [Alphaproteobacteria bacterium]